MYCVEVKIWFSNGKVSCFNIESNEESDQRAYLREGKRAGWIKEYSLEIVEETW